MHTASPGRMVLVQSFCDRSAIRGVWGPFRDEEASHQFEQGMRDAGLGDTDLWETVPLRSLMPLLDLIASVDTAWRPEPKGASADA